MAARRPTCLLTQPALWLGLWSCVATLHAGAQAGGTKTTGPSGASIYTCVDAQGRRLSSDRPIAECMDREQRELTPNGNVRRIVPPVPTAEERARDQARQQADAQRRAQADEERHRDRALLLRYPNQASHDKARANALAMVDSSIAAARKQLDNLDKQRQSINGELEFYRQDPSKTPVWLKTRQNDNARQRTATQMSLDDLLRERDRTNQRFDEELQHLRGLWSQQNGD